MAVDSAQREWIDKYVAALEALAGLPDAGPPNGGERHREDRGALAMLKRCAGQSAADRVKAFPLLYRLLPTGVPEWQEETFFLVASLFPFAPGRYTGDLGQSLRAVVQHNQERKDGIDRRMAILLDCSWEELGFRLRQIVHLLASLDVGAGVDWRQLLADLLHWDHRDRPVQKRWARSYFGAESNHGVEAGTTAGAPR